MRQVSLHAFLLVFVLVGSKTLAEEYRGIFWNLHSGNSSSTLLASQMVAKGDIDFWGLSEVEGASDVAIFEAALEAANPGVDYIAKISEEGGSDSLAIIYRSDRLTSVPYAGDATIDDLGDNFFEVDSINVGGTIRPALGIVLEGTSGQRVVVLVNHWKCCGGSSNEQRRLRQAVQMNAFAIDTPGIPIVSGGDFNIPLNRDGRTKPAFLELTELWEIKEPQAGVGTFRSGSVLDAVFTTNKIAGWEATATILARDGDSVATTATFSDNSSTTDHRPLLLLVESDETEHLDSLREAIADLRAALARLEAELARLEGND
jgi:hypothetical protein